MLTWVGPVAMSMASGVLGQAAAPPEPLPPPAPEHAVLVYEWAAVTAECEIDWTVIGGVAGVASNHALLADTTLSTGAGLSELGQTEPAIFGPPLNGAPGRALVLDSDQGMLDADEELDRAVGPFQFLPSTWTLYGADGNGDGVRDPQNLWDAAAGAAAMLCDKGATDDIDGAYTAYFGTEEWNDWAHRRRLELVAYDDARPDTERPRAKEVVNQPPATTDDQTSAGVPDAAPLLATAEPTEEDNISVAGNTQLPGTDEPGSVAFSFGSTEVEGDWNGDGSLERAHLVLDEGDARFELRDANDRPFGAPVLLEEHLPVAQPQQLSLIPLAGDWNGDGIDTTGLVTVFQTEANLFLFDERGDLLTSRSLGQVDILTASFVVTAVEESITGPDPVFWKLVTAHDGTEVQLFRVGSIVVAEELAQPLSDLLGAAAEDEIELDGWGWRSHQEQIDLRAKNCADVWTTPAAACTPPTAIAGTSRHEVGLAIDFHIGGQTLRAESPAFSWLTEHAATYGLKNLPSEPWHWSTTGG